MKRKLALILAGCLAISPLSANLTTIQAFAAEHTESEDSRSSLFSVYVSDENGCELDEGAIYPLSAGESRNLTAAIGGDEESSSYFVTWNSEEPEIVSLDHGGSLSALSSGTTKIYLNVSNGSDQYSFCYTVRISEPEISEETEEEVSEEAVDEIETAVEGDPAETEVEPAVETEVKADSAVEAEAEIEPADDAEPALEAEAEIEPDGAEPAIEDESIKADAEGDSAADDLIADLTEDPMDDSMSVSKTAEMAAVTGEKVTKILCYPMPNYIGSAAISLTLNRFYFSTQFTYNWFYFRSSDAFDDQPYTQYEADNIAFRGAFHDWTVRGLLVYRF